MLFYPHPEIYSVKYTFDAQMWKYTQRAFLNFFIRFHLSELYRVFYVLIKGHCYFTTNKWFIHSVSDVQNSFWIVVPCPFSENKFDLAKLETYLVQYKMDEGNLNEKEI
jgi:hypothetical protein